MHANVLVTVSGPDTPGITAAMTRVLAEQATPLHDVEQVVVHGQLTLCMLLDLEPTGAPVLDELQVTARQMGLALNVDVLSAEPAPPRSGSPYAITAIADRIEARHVQGIADCLATHGANIAGIERLSDDGLSAIEVRADVDPEQVDPLRHALLELALALDVDLAVQPEGLSRRSMRLVAMDMDSTLIQVEVIDELARVHGVSDQVKQLTATAMAGDLDYEESLRRRVALLEGLSFDKVLEVAHDLPLTPGAESLVRVLKRLGYKTAVISGGFDVAAAKVQERLSLDHAHSNQLEVVDGVLTGRVLEPIVTPERKVQLLEQIARDEGIPLEQAIAIGDGANDLLMIERAGLGIAFHPKPKLRQAADTTLSAGGLDRVLYLLGLRASDTRG